MKTEKIPKKNETELNVNEKKQDSWQPYLENLQDNLSIVFFFSNSPPNALSCSSTLSLQKSEDPPSSSFTCSLFFCLEKGLVSTTSMGSWWSFAMRPMRLAISKIGPYSKNENQPVPKQPKKGSTECLIIFLFFLIKSFLKIYIIFLFSFSFFPFPQCFFS